MGIVHREVGNAYLTVFRSDVGRAYLITFGVKNICYNDAALRGIDHLGTHTDDGLGRIGRHCADECFPWRKLAFASEQQAHRAIKTASGIPAATLLYILQIDGNHIVAAVKVQIFGGIDIEGIVAVGPESCLLAVDAHCGLAHSTIYHESGA